MSKKNNDTTLVKNASFLMIAALVAKIIGALYKSPLSSTLGSESMGCFNFAQQVYLILLMIASFSIPQAVSKIMAEKIAFRRYRDAQRVFHAALMYAAVAGGAVALVCIFGASILVPDNMANARLALQVLAPTIFLSGILGVFRGYFQAYRNMMPTSISQILEQVFVAVVALVMSNIMIKSFSSQGEDAVQRWGAAGATMGTGAGVLAALLFMLFVYSVNRRTIQRRIRKDRVSLDESYRDVMRNLILIVMPIILSAFIYNVNGYINSYMYTDIMGRRGLDGETIKSLYAEYGYFMTLINIPLTLSSTAPTSMMPEVSAHYARKEMTLANNKIELATWISMIICIPAAIGLMILGAPVTQLMFPVSNGVGGKLMMLGAVMIILNSNSNISNGVLQGIGKPNVPLMNAAISLIVDVILLIFLLMFTNLGIYAVVIAMLVYSVVICVLNDLFLKKYLKFRNPWRYAYLGPLLASIPMAVVAGGGYALLDWILPTRLLGSISICLAVKLVVVISVAVVVYFLSYLAITKPTEEDMAQVPGGNLIVRFGRKLHIC